MWKYLTLETNVNGVTAAVVDEETMNMMLECPDKTYYIFRVPASCPVEALVDKNIWLDVD